MKNVAPKTCAGLTLVEMLMSIACGSIVLAAVIAASVSLQKSFAATQAYSTAESDQLRVLDYIAMDCRRANSVTTTTTPVTVNGVSVNVTELQVTVPSYYNSVTNSAAPNTPTLVSGVVTYGTGTVTINYYQNGTSFIREVKITNAAGTVTSDTTTAIATNVAAFTVTPQVVGSTTSTCNVMFFPTFLHNAGTGVWRSGKDQPGNGTGVNGDWYVRDTTAPTNNIGDVYYKSNNNYSLVENVKATSVYCSIFLRNAVARS